MTAGLLAVGRLKRFDALLATYRPFGDSDYIHEQLHASYQRRLRAVSDVLPSAGRLADAVSGLAPDIRYRVLGDTVVRCATQHAFRQVKTGAPYGLPYDICGQVFESAIQQIDRGVTCGPLQATVPQVAFIGTYPRYGWVWTEDHPNDVFGAAFRALVRVNYGELLATPSEAETAMLREGVSLLEELVPQVTRSTLTHAHIVGLFTPTGNWARRASSSQFRLGGTIFLNRETLQNPWWVAEHILHESLHQKLYDFRHAHSLLARDALTVEQQLETDDSAAVWVLSPWNTPGMAQLNRWDTDRVIAAFHVYVHLSFMSSIAEGAAPSLEKRYGPINDRPSTMTNPRTAFDRAHYLAQSLATTCWGELGAAGQLLVRWLTGVLADMDPAPPPKNAIVHLLLDRYLLEARVVERDGGQKALAEVVDGLCQRELATTCRILTVLGRAGAIDQFEDAARELRDRHDVAGFSLVRQLIARQLMGASSDGYTLSSVHSSRANADDMVQEMVEESSRVLAAAGAVGRVGESMHFDRPGTQAMTTISPEPSAAQTHNLVTLTFDRPITQLQVDLLKFELGAAEAVRVPPAVLAGYARANHVCFEVSSTPEVGQLLSTLAATVPGGGRILELGTGVGVGLGWIVHGLGRRDDVGVTSVERDPALARLVEAARWPKWVSIVVGDGWELVAGLGKFELIFVDIPNKETYDLTGSIAALAPGGTLIIDDIAHARDERPELRARLSVVRQQLFDHPDLVCADLAAFSSGVLMAVRRRT